MHGRDGLIVSSLWHATVLALLAQGVPLVSKLPDTPGHAIAVSLDSVESIPMPEMLAAEFATPVLVLPETAALERQNQVAAPAAASHDPVLVSSPSGTVPLVNLRAKVRQILETQAKSDAPSSPTNIAKPLPRQDRSAQLPTVLSMAMDPTPMGTSEPTTLPRPYFNPPPEYPDEARRRGQSGSLILRVSISADGQIAGIELSKSSGFSLLDQAALRAVQKWQFNPALRDGEPLALTVLLPVHFRLH